MDIHKILNVIIRPVRKKRMSKFINILNPKDTDRILDVGGTDFNWKLINYKGDVVLLNLHVLKNVDVPSNFSFVVGDGTTLDYKDNEFDIVFSNSVIEHVGTYGQQRQFASEVRRVGKSVWLQTPAKSFFFEPHYITPFIHSLPKNWQKKLLRNFSIWGLITRPSQQYIDDFVEQTRLLGYDELKELFPDCEILKEKFLFMAKSYIAVRCSTQ